MFSVINSNVTNIIHNYCDLLLKENSHFKKNNELISN